MDDTGQNILRILHGPALEWPFSFWINLTSAVSCWGYACQEVTQNTFSSAVTSLTRKPSCMYRGSMALRSSMVSYWPWQAFSFSRVPSMLFSSTKPTRKIIFTPGEEPGDWVSLSMHSNCLSTTSGTTATKKRYRHRGTCPKHAAQRPKAASWRRHT